LKVEPSQLSAVTLRVHWQNCSSAVTLFLYRLLCSSILQTGPRPFQPTILSAAGL